MRTCSSTVTKNGLFLIETVTSLDCSSKKVGTMEFCVFYKQTILSSDWHSKSEDLKHFHSSNPSHGICYG